jgi:hypothetical protein
MKFQTAAFTWFTFFGGFRWNKRKGWKTKHVMGLRMPESIDIGSAPRHQGSLPRPGAALR